ncbi:MBL fold metallo-hydrolase [Mucilaginibacter sp. KACC 22773]|uniref:MBL fold metallo-hydrolase n=1 Tax=Mucilaginibacter sp. KACC 22773 TaxID=3025671 RepID=UPI0023666646|nr:MBL fold metallo-hydrolase [Mucilaginibacter sp. KACC 22773]WDF77110.1 MBL fold metallo-hydrolase [Mucilaginibacter sp. KACC 22773]
MTTKRIKYFASLLLLTLVAGAGCRLVKSIGKNPDGDLLTRLEALPNYKNGQFQNLANERTDSVNAKRNNNFFSKFNRPSTVKPSLSLPWVKTDLKALSGKRPTVVWFGHSSLLIKTPQGNILIDPIFSGHAGPIPFLVKAFDGSDHYKARDMPPIDVLIISHDHYDHLDYPTVRKLRKSIKMVVVPMGVGSHFVYWGFDPKKIIELNWNQSVELPGGLQITATPARHRSNRTFTQNKTLWASYVIQSGDQKLFYSGDSGYGPHFKEIGERYGPFDLAMLECGQYSTNWPYTHMMPGQTAQAAADLRARTMQPVHWAKFAESGHPWNEPVNLLLPAAKKLGIEVSIPLIGQPYSLGDPPKEKVWWAFK